jgi:hypothetical protein
MTDDELKQLIASLAIAQKETDKQLNKTDKQLKETDRQLKETDRQLKETDKQLKESNKQLGKQLKELGIQIGGLGQKFGSFTEGLALPSMTKILRERFHMEVISPSVRVSKNGKDAEIDVLAYANSSTNEVYVVEVKSHLREEGINQLRELMDNFRQFFPEHNDKKIYGIIAAVDVSDALKKRVLKAGFYLARIKDESFSLDTPEDFKAKAF